jgi:hypothetical protein
VRAKPSGVTRINNLAFVSLAHNLTVSLAALRRFRAPPSRRVLAQTLRPL